MKCFACEYEDHKYCVKEKVGVFETMPPPETSCNCTNWYHMARWPDTPTDQWPNNYPENED